MQRLLKNRTGWPGRRALPLVLLAVLTLGAVAPTFAQNADNAAAPAPAAGAADADTQADEEKSSAANLLDLLAEGGWFMVPIGLCSLAGLTIIIERLIALRRRRIIPPTFLDELSEVFQDPVADRKKALKFCHDDPSPVGRVIAVGIRKMPQGVEAVEQGIEDAGANEVAKLRRNLRLLYGVSAIAPMIGLLGTVWGMIEAFQVAEETGLGSGGSAQGLAKGIYTALVTTFAGLCVAIPILIFYYYFLGKIERVISDLNETSETFVEHYLIDDDALVPDTTPTPVPETDQPDAPPTGMPATA